MSLSYFISYIEISKLLIILQALLVGTKIQVCFYADILYDYSEFLKKTIFICCINIVNDSVVMSNNVENSRFKPPCHNNIL